MGIRTEAKIYIAGASGMVGSAVLMKLKEKGFTNLITTGHKELNLLDAVEVKQFFIKNRPEFVIDAAARVGGIKANMEHQAEFLYENLRIQNNLIWNSLEHGVKKFLFLGTSCIYPRAASQPLREEYFLTGPFEPTNEGYAIAKTAGIKLCEYIYSQFGRTFISAMPCNIYGPNDHFEADKSHVMAGIIKRMHDAKLRGDKEFSVWGTGVARREFLFVDDLAEALLFLLENYDDRQFLNVGSGTDVSIAELAEMVKKIVGFEGKIIFDPSKPDGMPKKLMDSSKINALGWQAETSPEEGIAKTYKWFLENQA